MLICVIAADELSMKFLAEAPGLVAPPSVLVVSLAFTESLSFETGSGMVGLEILLEGPILKMFFGVGPKRGHLTPSYSLFDLC